MNNLPAELRLRKAMLLNIPDELKQDKGWIVWDEEKNGEGKPTKVLKNPHNPEFNASVSKPSTWSTFNHVFDIEHNFSGAGKVIIAESGFCCLDLDWAYERNPDGSFKFSDPDAIQNRQNLIAQSFDSYQEISPSGKGLHIWIRGSVPSGRRRDGIEIYSSGRYMSFTGNVYNNSPVRDYNNLVNQLWQEMGKEVKEAGVVSNKPQLYDDQEIYSIASTASNGDKFIELWEGRWEQFNYAGNQSDADIALLNMLAFYTQNVDQIVRMFHLSALGKRPKAYRHDYLYKFCLPKAFDQQVPTLDLDTLRNNLEAQLAEMRKPKIPEPLILDIAQNLKYEIQATAPQQIVSNLSADIVGKLNDLRLYSGMGHSEKSLCTPNLESGISIPELPEAPTALIVGNPVSEPIQAPKHSKIHISKKVNVSPYDLPPGIVGEIAKFIHDAAPRPVPEIALAAAIGLMSGVCGRAYNISGTGLNQYTFLLAGTGRGKEAINRGISKLIGCVVKTVPAATTFIGPAKIASSPALMKYISKTSKSFVSIMGEFADTLKKMSNSSRDHNKQDLRIDMLDIYNKSGRGDVLGNLIYSDKEKNTDVITAPAVSIIGESVPDKFYEFLSKEMITEGLLPRFCIIEYKGKRPEFNKDHKNVVPSQQLTDYFSSICAYALQLNNGNNVLDVTLSPEAEQLSDEFNAFCDAKINSGTDVAQELWNRAHIKALKLAALLAVGVNYINPVINVECLEWALRLVKSDVNNILSRFESGDIGGASVQNEQIVEIRKACKKYLISDWSDLEKINGATMPTHNLRVIPYSYLSSVCRPKACFKTDKLGPIQGIKTSIQSMLDCGELQELSPNDKKKIGLAVGARTFAVTDVTKL